MSMSILKIIYIYNVNVNVNMYIYIYKYTCVASDYDENFKSNDAPGIVS